MVLVQLIHLAQAVLAGYGAASSYAAITNLRRYEEPTEKLARYSGEAARQLRETRVTQAAGALALAASLLAALYLAVAGRSLGPVFRSVGAPAAMVCALVSARARMARYWAPGDGGGNTIGGGRRVPLPKMGGYNEARRRTGVVLTSLDWLAYSWVVASVVGLVRGY